MAQKTNLNTSPYFDDFYEKGEGARDKNYYKILFNPGKPIQARELNNIQSLLQNQSESFAQHMFKEGSMIVPGGVSYDNQFEAVKLKPKQFGIDITAYFENLVGKTIVGENSRVSATVKKVEATNAAVEYPTIYVKYSESNTEYEIAGFEDNEVITCEENIVYGNTTISAGTAVATTIDVEATATGSAVSISDGIYFVRGYFVKVAQETIILDYYTNTPSYKVGLRITEEIITSKDDKTLYDNAKGFTNYAAPGADRFKIGTSLTKKLLTDDKNTDFIELLVIENGEIKVSQPKTQYNLIKDYLAKRTYDESGDYVVRPFDLSVNNSLNDRVGSDGLFYSDQLTEDGNTPSDDLACLKVSQGLAYVRGYDIDKTGVEIIDLDKPRTTQEVLSANIPFEMGNLLRVNNITGAPLQKDVVYLQSRRKDGSLAGSGTTVGSARVYNFNLTDAAYSDSTTNWDLYLYDLQTYTELTLNNTVSASQIPATSYIKGKFSGASGYAVESGNGTDGIKVRQTSGSFTVNEPILINGVESLPRLIKAIKVYGTNDVYSVHQPTAISGFSTAFLGDALLSRSLRTGQITITTGGSATIDAPNTFSGITSDTIIRYSVAGVTTESYNRVASVSSDLTTLTLAEVPGVPGICDGSFPSSDYSGKYSLGFPQVIDQEKGHLYAELPDENVSTVDLSGSTISFTAQSNTTFTPASNTLTVDTGAFNLGISSSVARFEVFDEERYSIFYEDGSIEDLTSDKVTLSGDSNQVTFSNIENKVISSINATFVKNFIQSKVKKYNKSQVLDITLSRNAESGSNANSSVNDGLTFNDYYGLRVQDEEISLNYPDVAEVIAVYESLDSAEPVLDTITFNSIVDVSTNAIIGENIIGNKGAVARVVTKPSANTLGVVYLNTTKFVSGENVIFEESNISTDITNITLGKYRNITSKFDLDKAQKEQYYDYSRLVRRRGESAPSKRLKVIFDYYTVPSGDTGDLFTVNSYSEDVFGKYVPSIGKKEVRASDTLDFRPRVSVYNSTTASPFDFASRSFGTDPKLILAPNESSLVDYRFYLGRIDKLFLTTNGLFSLVKGVPSTNVKEPDTPDNAMEIATISLPPYLYNPADVGITLRDNRRYTMRDIGEIEDRVETLETTTSLSLLELNTQTFQVQDADGLNRFKSGFFVDDFRTANFINILSKVNVTTDLGELKSETNRDSIKLKPVTQENITDANLDLSSDPVLFDPNVQKTGDAITLKYETVEWLKQPFATKVENVNPFHVISYDGSVTLSPPQDSWVRRIEAPDRIVNRVRFRSVFGGFGGGGWSSVSNSTSIRQEMIATAAEVFMRSRNTGFSAVNLKPFTRIYQFLDGNGNVDFIPKLIEIASDSNLQNSGATGAFSVGETVIGSVNGEVLIRFRVAQSNHKIGPFNSPTITYSSNPYSTDENVPASYSSSSKTLNVDIDSLSEEAQGLFFGYLTTGMRLIGQTSGAVAFVKDLRLITDKNGFLAGSFFLRNPFTEPAPAIRIGTGVKTYRLSSSETNVIPLPGSKLISAGETPYRSEGINETWRRVITRTRTVTSVWFRPRPRPPAPPPPRRRDPLAQTFSVGFDPFTFDAKPEEANGAYVTAVDIYFANKDQTLPVTVELRTVELGTPTLNRIGESVTILPEQITVSRDASVATHIKFPYPIYLNNDEEYALVLLAPQSDQYEVWLAEMGEKTIETASLPDSQAIRHSQQFGIGSLFRSQNGSIWTPNQYEDLKFVLYRANFTATSGSALFHNPTLNQSNNYVPTLQPNPVVTLPRKLTIGITTTSDAPTIANLAVGRKVSTSNITDYNSGFIIGTGSKVASEEVTTGGSNYTSTSACETFNITGSGTGLKLDITASNGAITAATIDTPGNGYAVGDVVGIKTSTVSPVGGRDARITITGITGLDTLYLSNVQGSAFDTSDKLVYFDNSGVRQTLSSIDVLSSTPEGGVYSGNYLKVNHYNHGMYSSANKVTLFDVESDISPTVLSNTLVTSDTSISIASTANFSTFEGLTVSSSNPGFIKIENEIIKYTSVTAGTLDGITRSIDSTISADYDSGSSVHKYELNGVSLRRINKTHDVSSTGIDLDSYYVEIDRSNFDSNAINRAADQGSGGDPANSSLLAFNNEESAGGNKAQGTQNVLYNAVIPVIVGNRPSSATNISGQIRSVTGTSVSGSEASFVDQQYESVELGSLNYLSSTRLLCSNINEQTHLSSLLRNKSFTLKVDLETNDSYVSPLIFWKEGFVQLNSNRINNPISNYTTSNRVNDLFDDPHAAYYISDVISVEKPASSLKVLVSAYRHESSDFRVLYSLIRPDSSEVEQSFELFPGYDNVTVDNNQDGFPDVIDEALNSGLPDRFVSASLEGEFKEYEFSANNLGNFTGFMIKIVMSGTDQAYTPIFRDLRVIALA